MSQSSRAFLVAAILLAAALRFPAIYANHFHADEALFASWARLIAIWRDPLLAGQSVDKPPLLFYLQALNYPLFGAVEWAARMPNVAASLLTVPLTAVLSWRLYQEQAAALAAALIVATSPLAVQFSATAFTDPLLTALLVAALLWSSGDSRPFLSGLLFGLAVLTKHQAWLFLPLLMGIGWLNGWRGRQYWQAAVGFVPPLLLLLGWQIVRGGSLDLWNNQLSNFGGLRLAWSFELLPRLRTWAALWPYATGSALLLWLALSIPFLGWRAWRWPEDKLALTDALLLLFLFSYVASHWLLAVPVWDRYLLPLVPVAATIAGRSLGLLLNALTRIRQPAVAPALILLLLLLVQASPALAARAGLFPVGGRPDSDQGAWQIAAYLQGAPYGTVLYDHWFSWHWRYAFIDRGVYTSWFEHPQGLAQDLKLFGKEPGKRYLVLPGDASAGPVLRAVRRSGFRALPVLRTEEAPGMILYLLRPE